MICFILIYGGNRTWSVSYSLLPFLQITKKQETVNVCNFLYYGSVIFANAECLLSGMLFSFVRGNCTNPLHMGSPSSLFSTKSNHKSVLLNDLFQLI